MNQSIELAREFTADHPLLLLAILRLGFWRGSATADHRDTARSLQILATVCAVGTLVVYAGLAIWYALIEPYDDLAEPTITAVAWLVHSGGSPYHALDAPARYAHIYGPMLFLAHAAAFRLFGSGIGVSKAVGVAAALTAMWFLGLALRTIRSRAAATAWTAVAAIAFLALGNMSFWTRAEPLLTLCVTGALLAALSSRASTATIGVGLAAGLAAGLKLTGILYILPVLPLVVARHSLRVVVRIGVITAAIAVVPFLVLPAGAAADYWFWFTQSSRNGLRLRLLRPNIEWALSLAAPLSLPFFTNGFSSRQPGAALLAAAMSLVVVLGAKPGAGPHHLLPFVPLIVWFGAAAASAAGCSWSSRSIAAYVLPLLIVAAIQQTLFVSTMVSQVSLRVADDIDAFLRSHPSEKIEMGYSGTSNYFGTAPLSYFRPLLVFHSGSYLLDAPAVQEHQLAGIEIPDSTLRALERCEAAYRLIPRDGEPFAARNLYPQTGHRPLFPDAFRAAFREYYSRTSSTRYFDVYACKGFLR